MQPRQRHNELSAVARMQLECSLGEEEGGGGETRGTDGWRLLSLLIFSRVPQRNSSGTKLLNLSLKTPSRRLNCASTTSQPQPAVAPLAAGSRTALRVAFVFVVLFANGRRSCNGFWSSQA